MFVYSIKEKEKENMTVIFVSNLSGISKILLRHIFLVHFQKIILLGVKPIYRTFIRSDMEDSGSNPRHIKDVKNGTYCFSACQSKGSESKVKAVKRYGWKGCRG